jgi:predicted phage terminase large subunit-like protein
VTATEDSDETGIIVAGTSEEGRAYVLEDCSGRYSPQAWAERAIDAYQRWGADRIVCEVNNGGDMVVHTLRIAAKQRNVFVRVQKITASRGKYTRAEPVAALYEQGLVEHVGIFDKLERQCCEWIPGLASPDRVDALVWALTVLFIHRRGVLYPQAESTEDAQPEREQRPEAQTFADSIAREGVWFPRSH